MAILEGFILNDSQMDDKNKNEWFKDILFSYLLACKESWVQMVALEPCPHHRS